MLRNLRHKIEQLKGQLKVIESDKSKLDSEIEEIQNSKVIKETAREYVQQIALQTQEVLKVSLESIVTTALDIVFEDKAYGLDVEFVPKRGKTECNLRFTRDNCLFIPMKGTGYGAVDVASFALRLVIAKLVNPPTRNTFILDEPFKHLSVDLQERAYQMVSHLCDELGIQVILVTHVTSKEFLECADRVFKVEMVGNESKVKVIQNGKNIVEGLDKSN